MKKYFIISSILVLAIAFWRFYSSPEAAMASDEQAASRQVASQASTPATVATVQSKAADVSVQTGQAMAQVQSQEAQMALRAQNEIRLDRRLSDYRTMKIEDRNWAILGSREAEGAAGKQTVLVLRDELSGQLAYCQSGLRFVLKDGVDYEAFIRERSKARRLFVNPLYGEIALDLADITDEYVDLSKDERVARLDFIPLAIPVKPK
ncbi:hypothetical protein [Undibacterium sp. TS12]|uniref:hypothetical protein n=1 Tax=Undibacterium sp. TS12 TaxID=2908202 RepID=UPI001F4CFC55|nr:hypothetical protein [Undibacterium sp. TS12]MCH8622111.1 hypothetical protein [Undibacterium sp. TS12]